jgi:VWFA-related protein
MSSQSSNISAMKTRLPVVVALVAQLATGALAQQPQPSPTPPPVEQQKPQPESDDVVRITTNLVQVDAVVTDKQGKLVTDLLPEEVEIFEDGRKQKITHFSYNATTTEQPAKETTPKSVDKNAPPVPPSRLRPEDVRRTIALVVDDLGLSFESTHFVRDALKKFVDRQMQPGDLVAIIRTSGGMGALQQFTSDKRQLYAAIDRVKWYASGRSGVSAFTPITPPTPGEQGADIDAAAEEFNQFREDVYAVGTLGAVNYVVRGLRELPGRKSILLISDGFRIFSQDDPNRNFRTLQKLQRLIDEAGRASVVIYTINATGLQTLMPTAADDFSGRDLQQMQDAMASRRNAAFETQEGLDYLAYETGGMPIKNTNDLSGGIRRVLAEQKGYYLIGYRPDQSTFDPRTGRRRFHHLTVKVKRPGKFNVRMRHGFYGVSDDEKPKPKTLAQQLFDALASPFGATGVHLQLTSLFANDASAGSIMRSLLYIDPGDLTFTQEGGFHRTTIDVMAITFGDNGVPIDQIGRTYQIKLTDDDYKRTMRQGLVYMLTVPVKKAGAYQLRVSLRDSASDRVGSSSQFIEAPDIKKKRLALSGLVVRAQPANQSVNAAMATQSEGREEGDAETSAAVRHFKIGNLMTYAFYVYNAKLDTASHPQLMMQVKLFRDGAVVFTGKETQFNPGQQTDMQRLVAAGAIKLGSDLTPGDYVIQIVVTDLLADQKHRVSTQWMDFQVVR